jgi:hypothetical protein
MTRYQIAEIESVLGELEDYYGPCLSWSETTTQQFGLRVCLLLRPVGCEAEHQRAIALFGELAAEYAP